MADDDLTGIIAQALADAREKGLEDVDQTGHAVRVVLAARPDMAASDAMAGGAVATGIAPTNA